MRSQRPVLTLYCAPYSEFLTPDLPRGSTRGLQRMWCFVISALWGESVFQDEEDEERVEEE